jgi:hypothetical protein
MRDKELKLEEVEVCGRVVSREREVSRCRNRYRDVVDVKVHTECNDLGEDVYCKEV